MLKSLCFSSVLASSLLCVSDASSQPSDRLPTHAAAATPARPAAARRRAPEQIVAEPDWGQNRMLDGHRFPIGAFVPLALPASYLGVRAGVEYHSVPAFAELPSLLSGGPQLVGLETINAAENIDFAVRLHEYVAIFGGAYGRARVGANVATLLGTGADYTYGGDIGALAKIFRLGDFQLGVRVHVGYYAGQSAEVMALFHDLGAIARQVVSDALRDLNTDLNQAIARINAAFWIATAELLTPFDGALYGGSIDAAQALGRFVGLQFSVGLSVDSTTYTPMRFDVTSGSTRVMPGTVSTFRPSFAAAIDVDLEPAGFPLDVMVEYRINSVTMTSSLPDAAGTLSSIEHLLALGLYYSGRTDLQLGVTGYTLRGQLPLINTSANTAPSGKPRDLGAQLVFRYFW
jgi:hypothetical protein